jgi:hypothetical protein
MNLTKRVVSKSKNGAKILTKRASVFNITERFIYKTSEAIYHNVRNGILKLAALRLVSQNLKK